jgi:hypothetical protein
MGLFSGSHREGAEKCGLLGYYAASSGYFLPTFRINLSVPSSGPRNYFLPTFRDNLSVPSSGLGIIFTDVSGQPIGAILIVKELFLTDVSGQLVGAVRMATIGCPETSLRNYHYSLRDNPEERSSQRRLVLASLYRAILARIGDA